MPKENKFQVEYAKSSMSTCRVCMAKIPKDSLRIGHTQVDVGPEKAEDEKSPSDERLAMMAAATRWHMFECFPTMKGAKWMAANLPADPTSIQGFSEIKKADQKRIVALWKALRSGGTATASSSSASGKRKADDAAGAASKKAKTEEKIAKLTSTQGVLSAKDYKKIQKEEEKLSGWTIHNLQEELRKNDQLVNGKKPELVQRVAEGRTLGSLPHCPRCEKGMVHWSRVGGWYSCPGHWDKDIQAQKRCYWRSKELERGSWKVAKK